MNIILCYCCFFTFYLFQGKQLKNIEITEILYALEFSVKNSSRLSLSYNKYLGYLCVAISNSVETSLILPETCVFYFIRNMLTQSELVTAYCCFNNVPKLLFYRTRNGFQLC